MPGDAGEVCLGSLVAGAVKVRPHGSWLSPVVSPALFPYQPGDLAVFESVCVGGSP